MTEKILFVDDDANVLSAYKRQLRKRFAFVTAQGPEEALTAVKAEGPFAVVVSDMQMPGMNGVELLAKLAEITPNTVRMMLTGNADQQTAVDAVNSGNIFRFYTKPCAPETLATAIEAGLAQYRLITAEQDLLQQTLAGSVKVLVDVLSLVEPEAFARTKALRDMTRRLAEHLKLGPLWQLDMAAMLSPIGRVTLPPEVRSKLRTGEPLDKDEKDIVAHIPEATRDLIANIPRLKDVSEIIYYQRKGFDGSGFPKGAVAGKDIPAGARILRLLSDIIRVAGNKPCTTAAFAKLKPEHYDPKIYAAARTLFVKDGAEAETDTAPQPETVTFLFLRPGQVLAKDLESDRGQLILAAGHELTPAHIEKLRNLWKIRRLKEPFHVFKPKPDAAAAAPAKASA